MSTLQEALEEAGAVPPESRENPLDTLTDLLRRASDVLCARYPGIIAFMPLTIQDHPGWQVRTKRFEDASGKPWSLAVVDHEGKVVRVDRAFKPARLAVAENLSAFQRALQVAEAAEKARVDRAIQLVRDALVRWEDPEDPGAPEPSKDTQKLPTVPLPGISPQRSGEHQWTDLAEISPGKRETRRQWGEFGCLVLFFGAEGPRWAWQVLDGNGHKRTGGEIIGIGEDELARAKELAQIGAQVASTGKTVRLRKAAK